MIILAVLAVIVIIISTASAIDHPPQAAEGNTSSDPGQQPAHRCRGPPHPPGPIYRPDGGQPRHAGHRRHPTYPNNPAPAPPRPAARRQAEPRNA
jgi:hypothetical protein